MSINSQPAAPTTSSPGYCQNTTATALTATGTNLLWYTVATGGTGDVTAPTPPTTSTGSTTWYVTQTSGCESPRTPVLVTVNAPPSAPTAPPQTYCQNDQPTALTATGINLLWYTDATGGTGTSTTPTPSTTDGGTTTWYVSQTSGCESPRTPVTVTINTLPKLNIGALPTSLCAGSTIPLDASGASSYEWSPATDLSNPAISNPTVLLQGNIQYTVTGTDANGCTATAQVSLEISSNCLGYYVPNAFTPNGDGRNDQFRVKTSDVPKSFSMLIFNRYGGKVFESGDISAGWNGYLGGHLAQPGTYVYLIAITTSAGATIEKKGTVEVIR